MESMFEEKRTIYLAPLVRATHPVGVEESASGALPLIAEKLALSP